MMTIELALCLLLAAVALPASRSIAAHYAFFAMANLMMWGIESADTSILAAFFAALAIADCLIILYGGHMVLLISAMTSLALSLESINNGDWLLAHIEYLSIATNAVIIGCIIKEYRAWMHGRSEHS